MFSNLRLSSDARSCHYRMPAEWEPHLATWFSWPKDPVTWPDCLPQVEQSFLDMMFHLSGAEKIRLLVDHSSFAESVWKQFQENGIDLKQLEIFELKTQDAWIRDYGPNFLVSSGSTETSLPSKAFNHWFFNAWGDKYESLKLDSQIPDKLAPLLQLPFFEPGIVLEGGSIDVNGRGSVLTTEQCLLNKNRNPDLNRAEIESYLKRFLNIDQVLWLAEGIVGDDTDGHIDDLARFVGPNQIFTVVEQDPQSPNYAVLKENENRLKSFKNLEGKPFEIVSVPLPAPLFWDGRPLPASYANFYIGNSCVLVPIFDDPADEQALNVLQKCFPNRKIVGIDARHLVVGMGACHCLTQQEPLSGSLSSLVV